MNVNYGKKNSKPQLYFKNKKADSVDLFKRVLISLYVYTKEKKIIGLSKDSLKFQSMTLITPSVSQHFKKNEKVNEKVLLEKLEKTFFKNGQIEIQKAVKGVTYIIDNIVFLNYYLCVENIDIIELKKEGSNIINIDDFKKGKIIHLKGKKHRIHRSTRKAVCNIKFRNIAVAS